MRYEGESSGYRSEVCLNDLSGCLKNLPDDSIVLIISNPERYDDTNVEILKLLCNEEKLSGLYITLDHPYDSLIERLKSRGVDADKLFFIDILTKNLKETPYRTDNCLFLPSPKNVSDVGLAIDESIRASKNNKKFLFVDCVSALLFYNSLNTVKKFEHFLTIRMRIGSLKGILISLNSGTEKQIVPFMMQFCDKVIRVK